MVQRSKWLSLVWLTLAVLFFTSGVQAQDISQPVAIVLEAEGPLTPSMATYIERGLEQAAEQQAELVILQLNTPGGEVGLMETIIGMLRSSEVPVVVYVAPNGAMAASAGTLITLAGHQAAMAPETVIGAASPVGGQGEDIDQTMATKVKETMKATVRAMAAHRGPEAIQLAEQAIDEAKAASAQEALDAGLIDFIATSRADLLQKLDGVQVNVSGEEQTLQTTGISEQVVTPRLIEQILSILLNPNIVFILLTIGVQAILIELSSPGGWVAGFVGAVSLLLAVYGMGVLPVNWFGIIFLIIAFVLFVLDIKAPTHGALTVAGAISFIVGALVLFNSARLPGVPRVSVPLVIGTGVFVAATFSVIVGFAVRVLHTPVQMGRQTLVGKVGQVRQTLDPVGTVQVAGELWSAELVDSNGSLPAGAQVVVMEVDGLRLRVRPAI